MLDSITNHCFDLNKLRYICEKFFVKYQNETDPGKNEIQMILSQVAFLDTHNDQMQFNLVYQTNKKLNMICELTYCGKCLLIAAYLASYNSQSTDKRFFSFQSEKQRKQRKTAFTKDDQQIAGPRKFTFERLYQIYSALQNQSQDREIVDFDEMKTKVATNSLFHQFQTFVSQKLILIADSLATHSPYSSSSKYCLSDSISNAFVKELAGSIDIELDRLLEKNLLK